jgi:hypothetical protein
MLVVVANFQNRFRTECVNSINGIGGSKVLAAKCSGIRVGVSRDCVASQLLGMPHGPFLLLHRHSKDCMDALKFVILHGLSSMRFLP